MRADLSRVEQLEGEIERLKKAREEDDDE